MWSASYTQSKCKSGFRAPPSVQAAEVTAYRLHRAKIKTILGKIHLQVCTALALNRDFAGLSKHVVGRMACFATVWHGEELNILLKDVTLAKF